jgi:hypothetical protein
MTMKNMMVVHTVVMMGLAHTITVAIVEKKLECSGIGVSLEGGLVILTLNGTD